MRFVNRLSRRAAAAVAALAIGLPLAGVAVATPHDATAQEPALEVSDLTAESKTNPLGLGVQKPRFGWMLGSDDRGVVQTAYRIQVASDEEALADGDADVWDSGKVESSETTQITYDGPELASTTRYHWRVQVFDGDDTPSGWSEPAWWETALMGDDTFDATWIGHQVDDAVPAAETPADEADGRSPQLRTEFQLDKPVAKARVYASALGVYELNINGGRVGDHQFAPGWTDYDQRVQYQTYDVTDQVHEGANALGAMIGTGWYAGHIAIFGPEQYGTQPWFAARLEVTYTDGTSEVVTTDDSWRSSTGPVLESDFLMGETYDARAQTPGWTEPQFDDTSWQPAVVNDDVSTERVAQIDPPVRITEEIQPVEITEPEDGVYVVDMGQNMVGTVRMRVDGDAGTTVRLRHAEVLQDDGTIYTENLRSAEATDHYTLAGAGDEVYEPKFTFHGFRYVEITGFPGEPDLDTLTGLVMHTDAPMTSSFESDDPMLNQLHSNIMWGQRGNFLSIPTDTPARDERMGWTGDINVFAGAAAYNMDVGPFLTKWLQDLRDAQSDDGAFPDVAPAVGFLGGGSAGWGDAGVTVPHTLWQRYGDTRVLKEHYPAMQAWIDYLIENSDGYLRPPEGYGDWLNIDDETPKDVVGTAYFAHSAALVAEMAAALGEDEDSQRYEQLAEDVSAAFVDAYVDEDGRIEGDTQTAYVLALGFDVLPDDLRDASADRLVELIEQRDWHLSTGFLGTPDLLPVLTETGHTDVAYRLITQDTFPSWGYQIANGATTMWEHWDSIKPDGTFQDPAMNSFNHYAYGAVGEWMFQTIAGIEPAEPGFDSLVLRPRPGGGLNHATASYDSDRGEVATSWNRTERSFELDATVPVNTTAEVWVPAVAAEAVTEGGAPADESDGVTFDRMEDGYAVFHVGSGDYGFVSDHAEGNLYAAQHGTDRFADVLDDVAPELSDDQADELTDRHEDTSERVDRALDTYNVGDGAAVRQTHRALASSGDTLDWLVDQEESGDMPGEVAQSLTDVVRGVHTSLSRTSGLVLEVRSSVETENADVVAGDTVEATATVENSGTQRIQGVGANITAPDGWTVEPIGPDRTESVGPGETFTARFEVTAPASEPVTDDVTISGTSTYVRAGGAAAFPLTTSVDVLSPVTIDDVRVDPRIIEEPGTSSTVTAVVSNGSSVSVEGDLRAEVPDGWGLEPAEQPYELPAGQSREVTFDVATPDEPAAGTVRLAADYGGNAGDSASVQLTYALESWLFETDGDTQGWSAENDLDDVSVSDGQLSATATGADPFFVNDGNLSLDVSDGASVEVTMRASADGEGQLFWMTEDDPGPSEGNSAKFQVNSGDMRTYRVPLQTVDSTLTGLRLDPLNAEGEIVIDDIRVVR